MQLPISARLAGAAALALSIQSFTGMTARAEDLPVKPVPAPPTLRREFRGVWIATVGNDDWPSKPGLTADQQRAELITLLDRAEALHLNAILFQVRPACDALYASDLEPWSPFLTGEMGKTPTYDPLQFAITEAHKRGMELHAWFNPFRVMQAGEATKYPASANHISKTHPEWVRTYGKMLWLDPGVKAARDYSLSVVADVVRRYDVDGVHIDDYFYPYKIDDAQKHEVDFPDTTSYAAYQATGGTLGVSDWRRSNIDDFVARMYATVKSIRSSVKVGISPFGIWRPGYPAQIKGLDSYEELYGDSRRWLREGWVDYWTPQLYWRVEQTAQSYPVLLSWWIGENYKNRNIWPGLFTSLAETPSGRWAPEDIEYQIKTTRGIAGASGEVHFSSHFLLTGSMGTAGSLPQRLFDKVYGDIALVPASPWLEPVGALPLPAPTQLRVVPITPLAGVDLTWTPAPNTVSQTGQWLVQWHVAGGAWNQRVAWGDTTAIAIAETSPLDAVAVTPFDHAGVAGSQALLSLPTPPIKTP